MEERLCWLAQEVPEGGRCPVQNLPAPAVRGSLRVKTEHGLGAALGYLSPDGAPLMPRIPPFVRRAPPSHQPQSAATHSRTRSDFSFGGGMGANTLTSSDIGPGPSHADTPHNFCAHGTAGMLQSPFGSDHMQNAQDAAGPSGEMQASQPQPGPSPWEHFSKLPHGSQDPAAAQHKRPPDGGGSGGSDTDAHNAKRQHVAVLQQTFSQILGRQFSTNDMRVLYSNLDSFRDGADDQLVQNPQILPGYAALLQQAASGLQQGHWQEQAALQAQFTQQLPVPQPESGLGQGQGHDRPFSTGSAAFPAAMPFPRVSGGLQLPLSAAPLQVTPPQAMSQQRLSGPVDALALIHDVAHGHNFSGLSDMLGSGRPSALLPVGSLTNPVGSLLLPGGPWGAPEPPPAPHREPEAGPPPRPASSPRPSGLASMQSIADVLEPSGHRDRDHSAPP